MAKRSVFFAMNLLIVPLILLPFAQSCLVVRGRTTTVPTTTTEAIKTTEFIEPQCNCQWALLDITNLDDYAPGTAYYKNVTGYTLKKPIVYVDECSAAMYCEEGYDLVVFDTYRETNFRQSAAEGFCDPYMQMWQINSGFGFWMFQRLYVTCSNPPRLPCEEGWEFFERPSGGWCMKVFPGTMTQFDSAAQCVAQGAVLSGLQNQAEINWVVSSSLTVIAPEISGGVWIGVQRRPECIGSTITDVCTKTNTFYWTDDSATGIDAMIFQQGEPNNGNVPNGNQNCALLTVASTETINAVSTYWSGQMDDITCDTSAASYWPGGTLPRANRAYLCGRQAKI